MPLDFPSSPTVNQVYNGYVWSGVAWEAATPNAVSLTGQAIVADAAARNVLFPSPVQGNAVFRNDLGYEETYYGLYNVSTNPGGKTPAGWYKAQNNVGLVPVVPTSVTLGAGSQTTSANGLVTFTNVTSFSLNGVFTSQFDSYKIIFNLETTTTFPNGTLRLRAAGTDASGATDYSWHGPRALSWAGVSATGSSGANGWGLWDTNSGAGIWTFVADVVNPARAVKTSYISMANTNHGAGNLAQSNYGGRHNLSTAYDGFSFPLNTAVFNGTIQVLGYNS